MLVLKNDNERKGFLNTYLDWPVILDDDVLGIKVYGYQLPDGYILTATTYRTNYGAEPRAPGRSSASFKPLKVQLGMTYNNCFYSTTGMLQWFKERVPSKVPDGYHPVGDFLYEEDKS